MSKVTVEAEVPPVMQEMLTEIKNDVLPMALFLFIIGVIGIVGIVGLAAIAIHVWTFAGLPW